MGIPPDSGDREYQKFVDDGSGNPAVRVIDISGGGVTWDQQVLGYDINNTLTTVDFQLSGVSVQLLTLGYDGNGNLITVTKS